MPLCQARNSSGGVAITSSAASGLAAVQQQQRVEELAEVDLGHGRRGRLERVDDVQPVGPGRVVAAQSVDRRDGVRRPAEVAGAGPARPLPALAEPLANGQRLVPVAGEAGDHHQPRGGQVALLAEERAGRAAGRPSVRAPSRSPAAIAHSAAMTGRRRTPCEFRGCSGRRSSSSTRRIALAAAARICPDASCTAVSWSRAARLHDRGSPLRRASAMARSASSSAAGSIVVEVERLGGEQLRLRGRVVPGQPPGLGEQLRRPARAAGGRRRSRARG